MDHISGRQCPFCEHKVVNVVNTRPYPNMRIYRRYECLRCEERWTTWESISDACKQRAEMTLSKDGVLFNDG